MKVIETTIYKCEYCNKLYERKHFCKKHELICKKNPDNFRACHSCKKLTRKTHVVEKYNYLEGSYTEKCSLLYCNKKEVFIHTPKIEIKGNKFDTSPVNNIPMPKVCKDIDMPKFFEDYTSDIDELNIECHKNLI